MKNSCKNILLILPILLLPLSGILAQNLSSEVTATSGAVFANETLSVEWTLGEIMTETYAAGAILTQGFHQPRTGLLSSTTNTPDGSGSGVKVYPNPATADVRVELPAGARLLGLHNLAGQLIALRFQGDGERRTTNVSALPAGAYFLRVQLASGQLVANRLIIH